MFAIGIFLIASIFSVLYFQSSLYYVLSERGNNPISFISLIYVFAGFVIYLHPVTKLKFSSDITYPKFGNKDVISIIIVVVGLVSIIPFCENLHHVLNMSTTDFTAAYDLKRTEEVSSRSQLSGIGHFCNGIVVWLKYINPILFFYALTRNKNIIIVFLSALAVLNPVLLDLITGGRGALFGVSVILVLNLILFRSCFSAKLIRRALMLSAIISAIMIFILFVMTVDRAGHDTNLAREEIYRYIGEGFVNISETGWYTPAHTYGHSIINGTGHTFFSNISNFFDSRDYEGLGKITHFRMYVYYTFIGDYFLDFGVVGGLLFASILAYLFYHEVKCNPTSFSSFIVINLYLRLALTGYGCFCYMNCAEFVIFTLIIYSLCRYFEPKPKKIRRG